MQQILKKAEATVTITNLEKDDQRYRPDLRSRQCGEDCRYSNPKWVVWCAQRLSAIGMR